MSERVLAKSEKRVRGMKVFRKSVGVGRKPSVLPGSVLLASMAVASTSALAQSSVTLYGVADDGIMFTNNQGGHKAIQAVQAGLYSTQFGFTGAEDIGGGTKVVFKLEGGVNINSGASTGAGGAMFGRQAWVGLSDPRYGTLRLGRQYDGTFDLLGPISATWRFDGGLGSSVGDLNNLFGDTQVTNAIKYLSPTIGGFRAELMYRLGGVAGDFSGQSLVNAAVSYTHGPVLLAAGYERVNSPAVAIWGATTAPVTGQAWANPLVSPIFSGYASAAHFQVSGVGASIDAGPGKIGLIYTNTLLQDVVRTSSTPFSGTAVFNDVQASYTAQVTPSWTVGTGMNYTWAPDARYTQFMLGTNYALSKSTLLYITSAYQHASGVNSLDKTAVAVNSNVAASNSPNQLGIRIGIHHNF